MSQTNFSLSQAAKLIGFAGGQNQFANWLRAKKMVKSNLEPMQRFFNREYFSYHMKEIKPGEFICTSRIEPKGLEYLRNKYQKETAQNQGS